VPLAAGIFWKRANVPGAAVSMIFGLGSWGVAELTAADATVPPQLVGLAFSISAWCSARSCHASARCRTRHGDRH